MKNLFPIIELEGSSSSTPSPGAYRVAGAEGTAKSEHAERAHSKFSASGAERWFECPGSVALSEGRPDKSSSYALEGTHAHEVLEQILIEFQHASTARRPNHVPLEMFHHGFNAAKFIFGLHHDTIGSELLVETRIYLDFIHPEMFGTFDGAVVDHFGTLHIFDYKYGAGVAVSPVENLQMIFYAIGVAHKYQWNFEKVRVWIIQPRIRGYNGPVFWDISLEVLRDGYVPRFELAVKRVVSEPHTFVEGSHCHWCKAKPVCPKKTEAKFEKMKNLFGIY